MKKQPPQTSRSTVKARALDARRLATVRGGDGLRITVDIVEPPSSYMSQQHNERLLQL